jgi:GNAT superfamily N-acetyltransferase
MPSSHGGGESGDTLRPVLRPIAAGDEAFLFELYSDTRREELSVTGWNPAQIGAFLRSQFDLQSRAYSSNFSQSEFQIILLEGKEVGRFYVARLGEEYRVVDLAVLSPYRGKGIGTQLLGGLIDRADKEGIPIRFHVEQGNRARRLYERLGFVLLEVHGPYLLLERKPRGPATPLN